MGDIAGRLATVRERVARACQRAGRDPAAVTLVAVSKTRPAADLAEASAAGQRHFGENRVQEAREKVPALPSGTVWHLVGHLQHNKAREAVRLFQAIHSVDSLELLEALESRADRPVTALLQVDLAGEPTKHGLRPEGLPALLERAAGLKWIRVEGLMCLPPFSPDPEQTRPYFRRLRELRDSCGGRERLPQLSMGMSHDFEVAVAEGATLVRVGEAIFGPRRARAPA